MVHVGECTGGNGTCSSAVRARMRLACSCDCRACALSARGSPSLSPRIMRATRARAPTLEPVWAGAGHGPKAHAVARRIWRGRFGAGTEPERFVGHGDKASPHCFPEVADTRRVLVNLRGRVRRGRSAGTAGGGTGRSDSQTRRS